MRGRHSEHFPGQTELLNVNSKDMPSVESTITAKLQQDPSVDHGAWRWVRRLRWPRCSLSK